MENPTKKKKIAMKKVKYQYKKNKKMGIVPLNKVTEYDLVRKGISGPRWRKRLQLHDNVAKRVYAIISNKYLDYLRSVHSDIFMIPKKNED